MNHVLVAEDIVKIYGKKVVLNNLSLKIKKGEIFGLLGHNGSGKSTFIRIISGLETQDTGTLSIFGEKANTKSRKRIGVAPQENAVYPLLTCMENLMYFGSLYGVGGKKARGKAENLLEQLGLKDKKDVASALLTN
ncbi:ABC transporter ATP-binding protein [Candidatus Micrarchaeota archaeon]|jgi:ABC-2 type transport system ATP-binding protein|nr:ABC transporter ATP-binding protein [Candidatus Micrarchaeota archaeon]